MAPFDPLSAAIGGGFIGLAAVLLMLLTGRIAGVAGIFGDILALNESERAWRLAFLIGLVAAPILFTRGFPAATAMPGYLVIAAAGLLVGIGTRLGSGCTSGHGICGIARLSPRSIVATMTFMAAAIIVVALTRHLGG